MAGIDSGNHALPSCVAEVRAILARKMTEHTCSEGECKTELPWLNLYRKTAPTSCSSVIYEPQLIVFAQGQKRVNFGGYSFFCEASTFLLTAVNVPVTSQVIRASKEEPILALTMQLDMDIVREIAWQENMPSFETSTDTCGIAVGKAPFELLDACSRLLDLLDTPQDIFYIGKLMQREIIYRLLTGPQGQYLRAIATLGEQCHRTANAIAWLSANYDKPLRIEELAAIARMGVSALDHHFRLMTALSPIEYQKRLRLQIARKRMLIDGMDARSAAVEVGYDNASDFNREYSLFFGKPPSRVIKSQGRSNALMN